MPLSTLTQAGRPNGARVAGLSLAGTGLGQPRGCPTAPQLQVAPVANSS